MELLIGALVMLLTETIKYFSKKINNKKIIGSLVLTISFVLSLLAAAIYITLKQYANDNFWIISSQIWAFSTLLFEVVLKHVLQPALIENKTNPNEPTPPPSQPAE